MSVRPTTYSPFQGLARVSPVSRQNPGKNAQIPNSDQPQNIPQDPTAQPGTQDSRPTRPETQLTQDELRILDQLKQIDTDVRRHEMAHVAAGGSLVTSGASFSYQKGPDGKNYAVAGEVSIDTSPVPGDPSATLKKMKQVQRAALAPASPSPQDIKVASQATAKAAQALSELTMLQAQSMAEKRENQAFGNVQQAAGTYARVSTLPEEDTSTFSLAV